MISGMSTPPVKNRVHRWLLAACLAVSLTLAAPSLSRASSSDDDSTPDHDARLDGYTQKMVLDSGGTALTYFVLVLMGGLCIGVMFISGKRSHLD